MAFIRIHQKQHEVGDWVRTTKAHKNFYGEFEVGTLVQVIAVEQRGYSITDDDGNTITEVGFTI